MDIQSPLSDLDRRSDLSWEGRSDLAADEFLLANANIEGRRLTHFQRSSQYSLGKQRRPVVKPLPKSALKSSTPGRAAASSRAPLSPLPINSISEKLLSENSKPADSVSTISSWRQTLQQNQKDVALAAAPEPTAVTSAGNSGVPPKVKTVLADEKQAVSTTETSRRTSQIRSVSAPTSQRVSLHAEPTDSTEGSPEQQEDPSSSAAYHVSAVRPLRPPREMLRFSGAQERTAAGASGGDVAKETSDRRRVTISAGGVKRVPSTAAVARRRTISSTAQGSSRLGAVSSTEPTASRQRGSSVGAPSGAKQDSPTTGTGTSQPMSSASKTPANGTAAVAKSARVRAAEFAAALRLKRTVPARGSANVSKVSDTAEPASETSVPRSATAVSSSDPASAEPGNAPRRRPAASSSVQRRSTTAALNTSAAANNTQVTPRRKPVVTGKALSEPHRAAVSHVSRLPRPTPSLADLDTTDFISSPLLRSFRHPSVSKPEEELALPLASENLVVEEPSFLSDSGVGSRSPLPQQTVALPKPPAGSSERVSAETVARLMPSGATITRVLSNAASSPTSKVSSSPTSPLQTQKTAAKPSLAVRPVVEKAGTSPSNALLPSSVRASLRPKSSSATSPRAAAPGLNALSLSPSKEECLKIFGTRASADAKVSHAAPVPVTNTKSVVSVGTKPSTSAEIPRPAPVSAPKPQDARAAQFPHPQQPHSSPWGAYQQHIGGHNPFGMGYPGMTTGFGGMGGGFGGMGGGFAGMGGGFGGMGW